MICYLLFEDWSIFTYCTFKYSNYTNMYPSPIYVTTQITTIFENPLKCHVKLYIVFTLLVVNRLLYWLCTAQLSWYNVGIVRFCTHTHIYITFECLICIIAAFLQYIHDMTFRLSHVRRLKGQWWGASLARDGRLRWQFVSAKWLDSFNEMSGHYPAISESC